MSPAITKLLIELIAVPVAAELLKRRHIHGATKETIAAFVSDPEAVVKALQSDKKLQTSVVEDFADAIDNVAGEGVNAIGNLFATVTPGGVRSNDS